MAEYLFSYGTFQEEEVQIRLFGRSLDGAGDILEDYRLSTIEIHDQAFLAKGEERFQKTLVPTGICGDFVKGAVFEVSEVELQIADSYVPNNYIRMKIVLRSGKKAWIYVSR